MRLGIEGIDAAAQREKGLQLARQNAGLSWEGFVSWFSEEIARFVERYDDLERRGPEEDAAILAQLARHERALLEFAQLEVAGRPDRSLEPVFALLEDRDKAKTA
jgi:hypothetical protein